MQTNLKTLIQNGESITTEFKESKSKLNKDVYETVCAFLNRDGGDILLGVTDDGTIVGVDADKAEDLKKDFLISVNNPQKLNPSAYLQVDIVEIDSKHVLHSFNDGMSIVGQNNNIVWR